MDEIIVEGKQATYSITSRVVPPNPPDKLYVDTPVDLIAINVETGKEVYREHWILRQQHNNEDLDAALRQFKILAANDFKRD
jgi:hypothetical protein